MKLLIYFLAFGCLSIFRVEGQEGLDFINISTGNELVVPKSIVPIVDDASGNLSVLIRYRNSSKVYLFDDSQKLVSEFKTDVFTDKANNFIGSSGLGSKFNLFFSNKNGSEFVRLQIDYDNNVINTSALDISLKKEYLVGSFQDNEIIYLVSILKDTSILKIYNINFEGQVEEKIVDLSQEKFVKFNGLETSLYHLIKSNEKPSKTQSSNINYNVPNSLEITSSVNKVYFQNGLLTITNDNTSSHTSLIQINIENGNYKYGKIPKKGFLKKELRTESNSFVLDNYYFSVYATTDKMAFAVYDMNNKSFVKEYSVSAKDSITFKNTPIIKLAGRRTKIKEPRNSAKFFRDIVNSNSGISAYKQNDLFVVSIGSSEKEQSMNFAVVGGILGGVIGAALLSAFDAYYRTTSLKIDCLFDEHFNHLEGTVPKNGFDRIKAFMDGHKMHKRPLQTIFKYKEHYIWGFYNRDTGIYKFLKFKE